MKSDLDRIQGAWTITALELDGQSMTPAGRITIDGERFTTVGMGAEYGGVVSLNARAKPKTFDLHFETGPEKGSASLGIYELKGDTWRICLTTRSGDRPTAFATRPGTGHALETLRRSVPAAVVLESQDLSDLAGTWSMVTGIMDGKPLPREYVKTGKRIAEGNSMKVTVAGQVMLEAQLQVDRSTTPQSIDYFLKSGQRQLGIFELRGDTLRTIVAAPGQPRPANFTPGPGLTFTEWRREP